MAIPASPSIIVPAQPGSAVLVGIDRSERLLAQAVHVSADAIFCQDVDGVVTTWNPAAERIYGYLAVDIIGRRAEELMPDRTRVELRAAHREALSGQRVERFDSWHERNDGTLVPVNVSAVPLRDEAGEVVAVATTVADVSERMDLASELEQVRLRLQRQNEALTRSNRDLEQFAYVASHDLSEPLRVMTGYVERIESRYTDLLDERGRRYLGHIVDASIRMRALIDDLLNFSRFLRAPRDTGPVDTRSVVDDVLRLLLPSLRESGTTVHVGDLPGVWSDKPQLHSLLSNLISNAAKFRSDEREPKVEIFGTAADGWVTLVVDDSGIGIAEKYRERVFRMFQRLHVREAYAGTGIGLAIAQQIVEGHGGRIWIEDSPLGGARFCCTLPQGPPGTAMPDAALVHILLVEDSLADIELTLEALEEAKFVNDVQTVRDGAAALDYLHRRGGYENASRPDLVILDLNLPLLAGHEVLAELKSDPDLRRIPVAVLTTSAADRDVIESYDLGANCFLTKPVDVNQFLKVVQSIEDFWFGLVRLPPR